MYQKSLSFLILIAVFLTGCGEDGVTRDSILTSCQDMIKEEASFHPRLLNIKEHGEYKYTFDVVFIKQGKEVEFLKGSIFDKNYACEYYPEEGMVYKRYSEQQIAEDEKKRKLEEETKAILAARTAKEKAARDVEAAKEKAARDAEAAKTTKLKKERAIEAEKKRVAAIKSKGEEFYGALCHSQLDDWSRNTYKVRKAQFKNNFTKVVIFVSDFRDKFPREFDCKITSVSCVSNSDPGGPRYETEVCAPS